MNSLCPLVSTKQTLISESGQSSYASNNSMEQVTLLTLTAKNKNTPSRRSILKLTQSL